jgi:hypothetical protein
LRKKNSFEEILSLCVRCLCLVVIRKLEVVEGIERLAQDPGHNFVCTTIDCAHQVHLAGSLFLVILIDAEGIDKEPVLPLLDDNLREETVQVLADVDGFIVQSYMIRALITTPLVGKRLI